MVERLSLIKAQAVAAHLPQLFPRWKITPACWSLRADTAVVLDEAILGKPASPPKPPLCCNCCGGGPIGCAAALPSSTRAGDGQHPLHQSQVWMRAYTETELAAYVATGSPLDKAGGYGIQDTPFAPVDHLNGCFASVMGFPLAELAAAVTDLGYALPDVAPVCRQLTASPCCQAD
jgi:predicted house-cleaning NTP pyrophosphatase (Maf/HAM1 superfamily)